MIDLISSSSPALSTATVPSSKASSTSVSLGHALTFEYAVWGARASSWRRVHWDGVWLGFFSWFGFRRKVKLDGSDASSLSPEKKQKNKKTRERYIYSKLQISYLMKLNHSRNKGKKIRVDILSSRSVNINTDSTHRRIINFGNVLY